MTLQYDTQSAIQVAGNPYQGRYKRVLCVCSAGILRSATAAVVLSQPPYNFNTRCVGVEKYALVPINDALIAWADEIICMTEQHELKLREHLKDRCSVIPTALSNAIKCLNIPDNFAYRDEVLIDIIKRRYDEESL